MSTRVSTTRSNILHREVTVEVIIHSVNEADAQKAMAHIQKSVQASIKPLTLKKLYNVKVHVGEVYADC